MGRVLTNGNVTIGAYEFLDRKKPCLCVQKGVEVTVYGTFRDKDTANEFMDELGKLVHAKGEWEG